MAQPLIGVDNPAVFCCGVFTVNEDNWKGVIALTDGVKRTVVYLVGGGFNLLKQAAGSIDGWKKLAGVIAPIAALTKFGEFKIVAEALEAISAQFDTFKLLQSGMGWVNIGDDLFKKGLVAEKHKSDNHHGENYVAFAKRILLVGVNTLKLAKFGNKIGLCADLALSFGGIPVMSILLAGVTTLGLIGNGLTFWTISNDKDQINEKINRFLKDQILKDQTVSPEKMDDLRDKVRKLDQKLEAELKNSISEEEPVDPANFNYAELKHAIAKKKSALKWIETAKILNGKSDVVTASSKAILAEKDVAKKIELMEEKSKLMLDYSKIAAEYLAIKAEAKAYSKMTVEQFQGFKNVQLYSRMSELDQKRNKELRDFACNVISIPGVVLGLVKDYCGLGGVIDLLGVVGIRIDDEDTMKAIISTFSLILGSSELFKFLYEENHKEEQKKISAAEYVALEAVA